MKSFQILGETYTLKLVAGLMERDGLEGYVDPHSHAIYLDKALKKNKRIFRRVLAHELCHCYAFESGLHEFLSPQALEMFCQTMSKTLCDLKV